MLKGFAFGRKAGMGSLIMASGPDRTECSRIWRIRVISNSTHGHPFFDQRNSNVSSITIYQLVFDRVDRLL